MKYSKEDLVLQFMIAIVTGRAGQERTIAQLSTEVEDIKGFAVVLAEEFYKNPSYKFQINQKVIFNSLDGTLKNIKAIVIRVGSMANMDTFTTENKYYIEYWGGDRFEYESVRESELSLINT